MRPAFLLPIIISIFSGSASDSASASPWVILDVRHHHYDDRTRIVFDLDRDKTLAISRSESILQVSSRGELRSLPCRPLGSGVNTAWSRDGWWLQWPSSYWAEPFLLTNPPRLVVDLHRRVGNERIEGASQTLRAPNRCP